MTYAETVIARHLGKSVFVDTNLLLLYLVGTFQRERVLTFKRTSQFTLAQFDFLVALIGRFEKVATTPHILTEINGLANALPANTKRSWGQFFAVAIDTQLEIYNPARVIANAAAFLPFGLTDAAIEIAAAELLTLTEDTRLAAFLRQEGLDALSLTELLPTF